jgi:hypothetical protein
MLLKEVFSSIPGGRGGYSMLFKQAGFKVYGALMSGWENSNAIPDSWMQAIIGVQRHFKKDKVIVEYFERLKPFLHHHAPNPGTRRDFSRNKLFTEIKIKYGSVDKFILHMRDRHGVKVQRTEVYGWFGSGFVPHGGKRKRMQAMEGFSVECLGSPPTSNEPQNTPTTDFSTVNAEDLF